MWAVINTYRLFRSQGFTRRQAVAKIYKMLDDLLTLLCALRVQERNVRERRNKKHTKE